MKSKWHIQKERGETPIFECQRCQKKYLSRSGLKKHSHVCDSPMSSIEPVQEATIKMVPDPVEDTHEKEIVALKKVKMDLTNSRLISS